MHLPRTLTSTEIPSLLRLTLSIAGACLANMAMRITDTLMAAPTPPRPVP